MTAKCDNLEHNEVDCAIQFQECPYNCDWQEAMLCCQNYCPEDP